MVTRLPALPCGRQVGLPSASVPNYLFSGSKMKFPMKQSLIFVMHLHISRISKLLAWTVYGCTMQSKPQEVSPWVHSICLQILAVCLKQGNSTELLKGWIWSKGNSGLKGDGHTFEKKKKKVWVFLAVLSQFLLSGSSVWNNNDFIGVNTKVLFSPIIMNIEITGYKSSKYLKMSWWRLPTQNWDLLHQIRGTFLVCLFCFKVARLEIEYISLALISGHSVPCWG